MVEIRLQRKRFNRIDLDKSTAYIGGLTFASCETRNDR